MGSASELGRRWLKTVRAGDTIAYRVIVAEARDQAGELALTLEGWILVRRRAR